VHLSRSGFISPRNLNNDTSLRGTQKGDVAISLYKSEIASPAARNDITAKGVRDTYETASSFTLFAHSLMGSITVRLD